MTDILPRNDAVRIDHQVIANMIEPGARVLDVGCGDGALLRHLVIHKQVDGRGIEISTNGVNLCVALGLSVIQGDADTDLDDYPDQSFDYVILSQTLQAVEAPQRVLQHLLRIGKRAIVSFPNFGHWRNRLHLGVLGRMPVTKTLPLQWYDTPNIHFCTIRDFIVLCDELNITIERSLALDSHGQLRRIRTGLFLANLLGAQGVFLLNQHLRPSA